MVFGVIGAVRQNDSVSSFVKLFVQMKKDEARISVTEVKIDKILHQSQVV